MAASAIIAVLGLAVISMADLNLIIVPPVYAQQSQTFTANLIIVPPVYAQQSQTFTAKLTGSNEVPPVNTAATGTAHFKLSADGKELNYNLSVKNLKAFTMAHIHQGNAGANGKPVAMLSIGKGTITSPDLKGPLAGKQISDLINMMKSGGAYINVNTQENPNGEIRGQIMGG